MSIHFGLWRSRLPRSYWNAWTMDKLKEIQVLRLARFEQETPTKEGGGQCTTKERNLALYEQEKLTKENDGQCKLEDKDMGAPQNQIIPPSHHSNMQQLLNQVKYSFAAPNCWKYFSE